jgi:hypothetical protein
LIPIATIPPRRTLRFLAANGLGRCQPAHGLKTTQKRQQFGGTIGGPLKKDATHYFANYEDTDIDDVVVVRSVLAPGTFPAPQRQGFVKLNHRFNDRNAFDARYSLNRNKQETQSVRGLNTYTGIGNLGTNPGFPQNLVEKRAQWVATTSGSRTRSADAVRGRAAPGYVSELQDTAAVNAC